VYTKETVVLINSAEETYKRRIWSVPSRGEFFNFLSYIARIFEGHFSSLSTSVTVCLVKCTRLQFNVFIYIHVYVTVGVSFYGGIVIKDFVTCRPGRHLNLVDNEATKAWMK
jgi:hypothetical protein